MLLAIDTGNTNVKIALVDATGTILERWRIATDPHRTADEYAVWLDRLLEMSGYKRSVVDDVIISTVVPRALHNLSMLARKYFDCEPMVAGKSPVEWHIDLKVKEPHALGADRIVNAIAAHSLIEGHKVVISFGTATAFDYIAPDGAYSGGSIAPGVNLSLDALYAAAAMLPRIAIEPPATATMLGGTTLEHMQIGIYWGYVGMIEGILKRMKAEIGAPVTVIATGGLAVLFQEHSHLFDRVEPELTLKGLAALYKNRKAVT